MLRAGFEAPYRALPLANLRLQLALQALTGRDFGSEAGLEVCDD
jgi:hypothetical protein